MEDKDSASLTPRCCQPLQRTGARNKHMNVLGMDWGILASAP